MQPLHADKSKTVVSVCWNVLRRRRTGCFTEKLTIMYSSSVTCHDRRVTTSLFRIGLGQIPVKRDKYREYATIMSRHKQVLPPSQPKTEQWHTCYVNKQYWRPKQFHSPSLPKDDGLSKKTKPANSMLSFLRRRIKAG